jgi:hypothetical protein
MAKSHRSMHGAHEGPEHSEERVGEQIMEHVGQHDRHVSIGNPPDITGRRRM